MGSAECLHDANARTHIRTRTHLGHVVYLRRHYDGLVGSLQPASPPVQRGLQGGEAAHQVLQHRRKLPHQRRVRGDVDDQVAAVHDELPHALQRGDHGGPVGVHLRAGENSTAAKISENSEDSEISESEKSDFLIGFETKTKLCKKK